MKTLRPTLLLFVALLCLIPCAWVPVGNSVRAAGPDPGEADDAAVTLEGRREALRKLEESAALLLGSGEKAEAARALNRVGRLHLILNAPQDALGSHSEALALLKQAPDLEAEVDALNGLGAAYAYLRKEAQAEEAIHKALSLSEQAGYVYGRAEALLTLSDIQNDENHSTALETAQKALGLWQSLGDKRGLARTYSQIGRCLLAQNAVAEATQNYQQALALWRELNNVPRQAETLISLSFIAYREAEWDKDIMFLTQAQALFDERADPDMIGRIAVGLGEAFNENGLPENALVQFQRALDYFRQTPDPNTVTFTLVKLGETHYLLKNYGAARDHLQQALARIAPNSLQAAQCYEYLGRVDSATGEHDAAFRELQSAFSIYTKAGNPREAAQVRALLGQLSERGGRREAARQFYRQALASFDSLSDRLNQAAVLYAVGRLESKAGRHDLAEDYLRRSVEVTEDLRGAATSRDLTAAFSATIHERYEKYIECLMRRHEAQPSRGLDVRAFELSELARARSLSELLRATQANLVPGLAPELVERERSLRRAARAKQDARVALLGTDYKKEELALADSELARLNAEHQRVSETIYALYPSYGRLVRPRAWDLQQIRQEVIADDQTLLLEYSLGENGSHVWAVTREGFATYKLPARAVVEAAAEKAYKLLSAPPAPDAPDALTPAVRELARLVLSPVAAELNKRRVIVVADGVLNYLPFQLLPAPADGEPLVAGHEVVNAPSASVIGELRQEAARRQPAPKLLAAFGNPSFASGLARREETQGGPELAAAQALDVEHWRRAMRNIELNRDTFDPPVVKKLFYAKTELAHLLNVAAGAETFVAEGDAATRERLLGTDLTQYAILHFATHGFLDPKQPENTGLLLSTVDHDGRPLNGFVGLRNIYELRAPVDLVVLSACQTALGKDVRGEGLLGLTRGFMYAGASSVVASLWKVDDEATAELMKRFYTNMLQEGMTPAAALRAAQNSIRQRPEWRSPYYWAAFTLQGDYRRAIKPPPAASATAFAPKAIAGGVFLTLLTGATLLRRGRRRAAASKGRAATRP